MKFRTVLSVLILFLLVAACSDDKSSIPITPQTNVTISSVVPLSGPAGTVVTIKGTNFGTESGELTIKFGGIPVTPVSLTDKEIKIRVPGALLKGASNIEIQRGNGKKANIQFGVEDPIVGTWVSEGIENISPLQYNPPFHLRKITATFHPDYKYIFVKTDSNKISQTYTGTYNVVAGEASAPNNNIRKVMLHQATPVELSEEGIYEIFVTGTGVELTYEVVQTVPDIGISIPTPAAGFGSTGGGAFARDFVQKYIK